MNTAPLRRPLGHRISTALRQSNQQKLFRRLMATAVKAAPSSQAAPLPAFYGIPAKKSEGSKLRTGFAVYTKSPIPTLKRPHAEPVIAHTAYQIRKMDPTGARTQLFSKENKDAAKVGDVLMVTTKRSAEPFSGVCIGIRRRGIESSILLRGQLTKIGVEMYFKIYSRNVTGIEIIHRRKKRARRAKLTFMRKPKHDMGSVDHLVREWRKNKNVFASKAGGRDGKDKKGKKKNMKKKELTF